MPSSTDRRTIAKRLRQLIADRRTRRGVVASALIALARTRDHPADLAVFERFLDSRDPAKAEAATLAMGIARLEAAVEPLVALATCSDKGHELVRRGHVPYRIRAFASYALGNIARSSSKIEVQRRAYKAMRKLILLPKPFRWDDKVAALHAIRMLNLDARSYDVQRLRHEVESMLREYIAKKGEPAQVVAHALTALADVGSKGDGSLARSLAAVLDKRSASHWLHQSAVQSLGNLAAPEDREIGAALRKYLSAGKDMQARFFAAIALGKIGGAQNRNLLLGKLIQKQTTTLLRPWLALGLAILDRRACDRDPTRNADSTIADAILQKMTDTRNAEHAAAFAIALGLMRYTPAGEAVLQRLLQVKNRGAAPGYMAVALGLMRYQEARGDLQELIEQSKRKPTLLGRAAVALALLGDKTLPRRLSTTIRELDSKNVRRTIADALGLVGDRRAIPVLLELVDDRRLTSSQQGLAVASLGRVAEATELPWQTRISTDVNYQAAVETLANGAGVLDR